MVLNLRVELLRAKVLTQNIGGLNPTGYRPVIKSNEIHLLINDVIIP